MSTKARRASGRSTFQRLNGSTPSPSHMCSVVVGDARVDTLAIGQERPEDLYRSFEKARYWKRFNPFVGLVLKLRLAFYHFGFSLSPALSPALSHRMGEGVGKSAELKEWLKATPELNAYVTDAWRELLVARNVISFWREGSKRPIVLLPGSQCQFTDQFGLERLTLMHRLTADQVNQMDGLTTAQRNILKSNQSITLSHEGMLIPGTLTNKGGPVWEDIGFYFEVLKDETLGAGLAWPCISSIFQASAQWESMEVGDSLLATVGRIVYEQHAKGHEIKSGPHAGANWHFWKKSWADAFEKGIKGKIGHIRMTTGHDHAITFPRPDPKYFEAKKYEAVLQRLAVWGAPFHQMLESNGINPFFLMLAQMLADYDRKLMGPHLKRVIEEKFTPPCPIKVVWSDKCFRDPRTALEMMKLGLSAGPTSQTTFLQDAGLDPEEERANKQAESALPDSQTKPLYDPAHGDPKAAAGRPSGTGNSK